MSRWQRRRRCWVSTYHRTRDTRRRAQSEIYCYCTNNQLVCAAVNWELRTGRRVWELREASTRRVNAAQWSTRAIDSSHSAHTGGSTHVGYNTHSNSTTSIHVEANSLSPRRERYESLIRFTSALCWECERRRRGDGRRCNDCDERYEYRVGSCAQRLEFMALYCLLCS